MSVSAPHPDPILTNQAPDPQKRVYSRPSPARLAHMRDLVANGNGIFTAPSTAGIATMLGEALAEIAALERVKSDYDTNLPCEGCNIQDGPEETCPRHGRSPGYLWQQLSEEVEAHNRTKALIGEVANTTAKERDEAQRQLKIALTDREREEAAAHHAHERIELLRQTLSTILDEVNGTVQNDETMSQEGPNAEDPAPRSLPKFDLLDF